MTTMGRRMMRMMRIMRMQCQLEVIVISAGCSAGPGDCPLSQHWRRSQKETIWKRVIATLGSSAYHYPATLALEPMTHES